MEKIIPCVELAEAIEPFYPKPKGAGRRPHPEDLKTAIDVRFIEVKGRALLGRDRPDFPRVQNRPAPC